MSMQYRDFVIHLVYLTVIGLLLGTLAFRELSGRQTELVKNVVQGLDTLNREQKLFHDRLQAIERNQKKEN